MNADIAIAPIQDASWKGDCFDRKADADYLTQFLINGYKDKRYRNQSFVLNLNAKWGFGKTYFLHNWAMDLRSEGHLVVSFDAWKNDFSDDALLSFISEISNDIREKLAGMEARTAVDEMIKQGLNVAVAAPLILAKMAAAFLPDSAKEALSAIDPSDLNGSIDTGKFSKERKELINIIAADALHANNQKRDAIRDFKTAASNFVSAVAVDRGSQALPIFFFIDELDRCRPDFAISLLESIKHIFPIEGFCFVIATDTQQLSQSIKSVYGNQFDSVKYLKRFFDIEYSFLDPQLDSISHHLFSSASIENFLYIPDSIKRVRSLELLFVDICSSFRMGPRDVQQVFDVLHAFCLSGSKKFHLFFLLPLICVRHLDPEFFEALSADRKVTVFEGFITKHNFSEALLLPRYEVFTRLEAGGGTYSPVSLWELINIYFSKFKLNLDDHRARPFYVYEFEREIDSDLYDGKVPVRNFIYSDIDSYFGGVIRAGCFI